MEQQWCAYENWEYSYHGEWWNIGSFATNVFLFLSPLLLLGVLIMEDIDKELKPAAPRFRHYRTWGGNSLFNMELTPLVPIE